MKERRRKYEIKRCLKWINLEEKVKKEWLAWEH